MCNIFYVTKQSQNASKCGIFHVVKTYQMQVFSDVLAHVALRCVVTQPQGGKTSAVILEKQVGAHNSTAREIIYKFKTFNTAGNIPRKML